MPSCLVCKYRSVPDDGVTYHKFPKNEQSRKLWISAIGNDNLKVTDFTRICSRHFPKDSFYYPLGGLKQRRYIKPGSIPTIFNNFSDHSRNASKKEASFLKNHAENSGEYETMNKIITPHSLTNEDYVSAPEKSSANSEYFNYSVRGACKTACTSKKYLASATSHTKENISSSCISECDMQVESQLQLTPSTSEDCANKRSKWTETTPVPVETMETPKKWKDSPSKWKRRKNPIFFGDCDIRDLKSPRRAARNWKIASDTINMQRRKIRMLQMRNIRLKRKVNDMQSLITQLKQKQLITGEAGKIISDTVSLESQEIWKRQFNQRAGSKYPDALRTFAMTLNFYSNAAYLYVRKVFMKSLPHPATVRRWYCHLNGSPGITTEAVNSVREKVTEAAKKGKKLVFALSCDEMSIRKCVELEKGEYIGLVDMGTGTESVNDDAWPEAEHALVFMITCANLHFKVPVGYYLISGLTGKERANLLRQCLSVLNENGINVISVTADGTSVNLTMFEELGAVLLDSCVDNLKPYFPHPVSDERIYVILDACHMIKLIRNAWGSNGIFYDKDGGEVCWYFLQLLVNLQEKEGLHAATKIRKRHLEWKKEVMKVKLATQVFSKSVADAITFCREDLKIPQFRNSTATSNFCLQLNDIFDLLNSRNLLCPSKTKRCITVQNLSEIKADVNKFCAYLGGISDKNGPILKSRRRTGFLGMIINLQNVVAISEKLFENETVKFFMTYKLSQDHLETFFSAIRSRGGWNNNPSCKQFKTAYKRLLVHAVPQLSKSANVEECENTKILSTGKSTAKADDKCMSNMYCVAASAENGLDDILKPDVLRNGQFELSDLEMDEEDLLFNEHILSGYVKDIVAYISGFVARRLNKVLRCAECSSMLHSQICRSALQKRKTGGGLVSASADLIKVCVTAEAVMRSFRNLFVMKNVLSKMVNIVLRRIPDNVFDNLAHMKHQAPLNDHRYQLLKLILTLYFQIRLHHAATTRNNAISRVRSMHTKLVLFKHQ